MLEESRGHRKTIGEDCIPHTEKWLENGSLRGVVSMEFGAYCFANFFIGQHYMVCVDGRGRFFTRTPGMREWGNEGEGS